MKKLRVPERLRSVKTLPEAKVFLYDPEEPSFVDAQGNYDVKAKDKAMLRGGERQFYLLEPKYLGSADFHNRIWTVASTGRRFLSAAEAVEHMIEHGVAQKAVSTLEPGTYFASFVNFATTEDSIILTQRDGKQITIKKN